MSNKRSLNHQDHHHPFQIPITEQIDTKKLKSNLQHNSSDERENHRIEGEEQFQISMKKLKFDLEDHSSDERENRGMEGEEQFQIYMKKLRFDLEDKSKERETHGGDGEEKFQMFMRKLKLDSGDKSKERESEGKDVDEEIGENLFGKLDENLLYEIFKHADARTLAVLSCVSKMWNRTAEDERLWELICTRRWIDVNHGGGEKQLRSVVLALGGFRRLYSLYLSKTAASTSTSAAASAPLAAGGRRGSKRWGKDEVNLSLSLLSIQFYEKMSNNNSKKGK